MDKRPMSPPRLSIPKMPTTCLGLVTLGLTVDYRPRATMCGKRTHPVGWLADMTESIKRRYATFDLANVTCPKCLEVVN